ncbi:MAG: hypothetical protein H8E54_01435 [Candidatus Aminicenantes bacterium]|nr:hypothetical protein [Candidatus Aminicenantes bacterium]
MSKFRVSKPELRAILLPEKYPSIEVAKKIRLPRKSNTRTKIDPELDLRGKRIFLAPSPGKRFL